MSYLTHLGGGVFLWVLQSTWHAAVLAGLILLAQGLLRKRLPPSWRYGLWLLLIVRLLMPVPPQSAFSIFNLASTAPATVNLNASAANYHQVKVAAADGIPANSIPDPFPANDH